MCIGILDFPYLQLHQSEPSSSANTTVVFDGRAANDRAQFVNRSRRDFGGFRQTSGTSP